MHAVSLQKHEVILEVCLNSSNLLTRSNKTHMPKGQVVEVTDNLSQGERRKKKKRIKTKRKENKATITKSFEIFPKRKT